MKGPITTAMAEAEPERDRLFGPSYQVRQQELAQRNQLSGIDHTTFEPWKRPRIERK